MKKYFFKVIRFFLRYKIFWKCIKPFVYFFKNIEAQKYWVDRAATDKYIKNTILIEPIVKHGFFKGMKYPGFNAAGSAVYPKFMGSYEIELKTILQQIMANKYDVIIDVGCAEGYYAIGLARLFPNATVYAYDTEEYARNLCQQIASLNNVQDRVKIKGTLNADELMNFDFSNKRALIISDCEGFEKQLFTENNIQNLVNCDVLIETHDLFDLTISSYLKELFSKTHQDPIVIASIDDNKKAQTYQYPESEKLDLGIKKILFSESRKSIMEWYFFQKKI